ncbi:hypothetical protein H9649_05885 [Sporosarcina sp. Sa2YVA2]|uniref:Uncharacterized protein n=1 Tax=Sporosarcina quadrami TaxID=2762234 RepID=A0ABR8U7V0_9BACL|nr:hypothetical protein [Sporosarcina quadrami]MBD7984102.1 hypothetical protein [Sporosarcina quadrami]
MNVHAFSSQQLTSLYSKSRFVKAKEVEEFIFTGKTVEQKDSSAIYKGLSDKYDVRNAKFGEIVEISNALYDAGEISLKEHAVLTFDYDRATNNLKRHAPGDIPKDFDMYETSANSNGQRDWISEFGARAAKDFKFGNLIGYQSNTKVLDILERLSR